jgi:prephenate dehydrogenase
MSPPQPLPARPTLAVLGTGALGGSVAAALRARGLVAEVRGFDPTNAQAALTLGWIDRVASGVSDAVRGADIVVLAAPVSVNAAWLREGELARSLAPDAWLTDVSSTKTSVVAAAQAGLGARLGRFVASHPIAGFDRAGPQASRADLFEGRHLITCPTAACDADALEGIEALWRGVGARVSRMDATEHDALFADISHWPHAVAFALSAAIGEGPRADAAIRFHGAGLRDTSRVGGSPADLWAGILLDNREAVLNSSAAFRAQLDAIEDALSRGDRSALSTALSLGERWRSRF